MSRFVKSKRRERSSSSASLFLLLVFFLSLIGILLKSQSTTTTTTTETTSEKCINNNNNNNNDNNNKQLQLFQDMLFANADRKIAERRAWLSPRHGEGPRFGALTSETFYYMFVPVLPCFWTFEKVPDSIQMHDGPKWTCGIQEVHTMRRRKRRPQQQQQSISSTSNHNHNNNNDHTNDHTNDDDDDDNYYNKTVMGIQNHYDDVPCIVYSMGSRGQFEFEQRIRTIAPGCEIHTFDPTYNEVAAGSKGKDIYDAYHGDYGFGGQDSNTDTNTDTANTTTTPKVVVGSFPVKSLETIMTELNHTHVDYLKADVEGYEWDFFRTVDWSRVKVGQILIELHPQKGRPKDAPADMTAWDMEQVFVKLEHAGYRLISLEPVTFTYWGQVEMVFIHKNWHPSGQWINQ